MARYLFNRKIYIVVLQGFGIFLCIFLFAATITELFSSYYIFATAEENAIVNEYGFASGDGSKQNPFIIMTPKQLDNMRNYLYLTGGNGADTKILPYYFNLGADIDLYDSLSPGGELYGDGKGWMPVGTAETGEDSFCGILDGQGYSIRNLWIERPDTDEVGLFGWAFNSAIRKLNIMLGEKGITGKYSAGGISGMLEGRSSGISTVTACSVKGKIKTTDTGYYLQGLGGVAGVSQFLEINNSFFEGTLEGANETGGLIGCANKVSAENCYVKAAITQSEDNTQAGGIFGRVTNFYLAGNIPNQISRCFVDITCDSSIDAFAGEVVNKFDVAFSYYAEREYIVADSEKYYINNVKSLTEVSRADKSSYSGFDFSNIWGFDTDNNLVLRAFGNAYDPPVLPDFTWLYITAACVIFAAAVITAAIIMYHRKKTVVVTQTEIIEVIKEMPVEIETLVAVEVVKEIPVLNGQPLPMDDFTPKEKRVAELLLLGKSYGEIAVDLGVTENTVKKHIMNVFNKTEVNSHKAFIVKYLRGDN